MSTKKNRVYTLSICLSDIPARKIVTAGKDGKMYCEMIVADKKEKDQYDFDSKVYCKQTDDERKDPNAKKDYCGRGKTTQFNSDNTVDTDPLLRNRIYTISVCLSDIPQEYIKIWDKEGSPSHGKAYVDICVSDKKETDKYGYDAAVYVRQSKEEREQGKDREYCGRGKMDVYGNSGTPVAANPWAVGGAGMASGGGSNDPGDDHDQYERDRDAQYYGSGNAGAVTGNSPAPFFGNDLTKDDLPF